MSPTVDARNASRISNPDMLEAFYAESGQTAPDSPEETIWVLMAKDGKTIHRREYDFTAVGMGSLLKDIHDWLEKGEGHSAVQHVGKDAPVGFEDPEALRLQVSTRSN